MNRKRKLISALAATVAAAGGAAVIALGASPASAGTCPSYIASFTFTLP